MKYIKLFKESYDEYDDYDDYYEDKPIVNKTDINGIYYHGTSFDKNRGIFYNFNMGRSNYDAIWFCDNESIAEEFSEEKQNRNEIKIIYKCEINSDNIANLINFNDAKDLMIYLGENDFRECYRYLTDFDGCVCTGSIGYNEYDDLAIFNLDVVNILKAKIFINKKWSDYLDLDEITSLYNKRKYR